MSVKRLAVYIGSAVLIYLLGIFVVKPLLPLSSQEVHMKQVSEHIKKITPTWNDFKSTNHGFELVKFRVYTGGDGLFGVNGYVTSQVQMASLLNFLAQTHPPRPLYTNFLKTASPEFYNLLLQSESEPGSSANQSQPVGPDTNRISTAAGSGR